MDLFLPIGTKLFHGTGEEFPVEKIRGGSYDQIIWTTEAATIAQNYIPISGGTAFANAQTIRLPNQDTTVQQVQKIIGLEYDYLDVEWDHIGRAKSFKLPAGWDNIPTKEEVVKLLENAGFEKADVGWDVFKIHHTYQRKPEGVIEHIHAPGEKLMGRLFIFTVKNPLKIYDMTLGGEREGDLLDVDYHRLGDFKTTEERGYDGVKINDFAQSENYGNLGHTSVGLFERAKKKLDWVVISATNFDWDEDLSQTITPEYRDYLERSRRNNPDDISELGKQVLLAIWYLRNHKGSAYWNDLKILLKDASLLDLLQVTRSLQRQGYIDNRAEGYWLYPSGFQVVSQELRRRFRGRPPHN